MLIVATGKKRRHMPTPGRIVVIDQGLLARPPQFAIDLALQVAAKSPCQKSKRGAAIYRAFGHPEPGQHLATPAGPGGWGFNGPPGGADWSDPSTCDGSQRCRAECSERCLHAEQRVLLYMHGDDTMMTPSLRMVHVKLGDSGDSIPHKGPQCHRCAAMILDSGVAGLWLHEERAKPQGVWVYYPARQLYDLSMKASHLYQIGARR